MLFNPGNGCGCCTTIATSSSFPKGNGSTSLLLQLCNNPINVMSDSFIGGTAFLQSGSLTISGVIQSGWSSSLGTLTNYYCCFSGIGIPGASQPNVYTIGYSLPSYAGYGYVTSGMYTLLNSKVTTATCSPYTSVANLTTTVPTQSGWTCCDNGFNTNVITKNQYITLHGTGGDGNGGTTSATPASGICSWTLNFVSPYDGTPYRVLIIYKGSCTYNASLYVNNFTQGDCGVNFTACPGDPINVTIPSGAYVSNGQTFCESPYLPVTVTS